MKKWYQYWTVWVAIALLAGSWVPVWIFGNQASDVVLGAIVYALALVAIVFFVVFAVQYNRAKKAAREAADAAHAAELREQWAQKQADAAAAKAAAEKTPAKPRAKFERHKVAGTSYHLDAIMALAQENPDYDLTKREIIDDGLTDERIYQYTFADGPVELVDDPDNEYDPNAIKVLVAGQHIGYIKRGSTGRIHRLQRSDRVLGVTAEIYGGKYKVVICDDDDGAEHYDLIKDETGYGAAIEILVRPEQEQEPVSTLDT